MDLVGGLVELTDSGGFVATFEFAADNESYFVDPQGDSPTVGVGADLDIGWVSASVGSDGVFDVDTGNGTASGEWTSPTTLRIEATLDEPASALNSATLSAATFGGVGDACDVLKLPVD